MVYTREVWAGGFAAGGRESRRGTVVRVIRRGQEGNRGGGVRARDSRHALAAEAGAVYTVPLIVYKNIYIKIIRTY
jgi:hypothetical protein